MPLEKLSLLARNRSLLQRQGLLEPVERTPLEWTRELGGLQAQERFAPHLSLLARQPTFTFPQLDILRDKAQAVRGSLQRGTIHLLATDDFARWLPFYRDRNVSAAIAMGVNLPAKWPTLFREELGDKPFSHQEFAVAYEKILGKSSPVEPHPIRAVKMAAGLVRAPGVGGQSLGMKERWTFFETLTGRDFERVEPDEMIRRYLGAFGPATASDFSSWSGLPVVAKRLSEMKNELWVGEDEVGRKLYDLPGALRLTGSETPPAVSILGQFDNAILSHSNRELIMAPARQKSMNADIRSMNPVLLAGFLGGIWRIKKIAKGTQFRVQCFQKLSKEQKSKLREIVEEWCEIAGIAPALDLILEG